MSVENVFLDRGGRQTIENIMKFMKTIIIKVDTDVNQFETNEMFQNWISYKQAYLKIDTFEDYLDYPYSRSSLNSAGFTNHTINQYGLVNNYNYSVFIKNEDSWPFKDEKKAFLDILRRDRLEKYEEKNPYYRRYLGLPEDDSQILYVYNKDSGNPKDIIELHKVDPIHYPNTYSYLLEQGKLKQIKKDYPEYKYVDFLFDKLDIYKMRSAHNFDILRYDSSILSQSELNNFLNCYENIKLYIDRVEYIPGFQGRYPQYSYLMEMMLLYTVFSSYCNSYMDKYTLCDYTDQEIFDILDSYNLKELKSIDMNLIKKLIPHLPDLIENRGSVEIMNQILDIIGDNMLTVKRYDLVKKIPFSDKHAGFDTDIDKIIDHPDIKFKSTYESGVELVFKESIIRKGKSYLEEVFNKEYDYDEFVASDEYWGGVKGLDDLSRRKVRENLRKEILSMDFSSILTKYINISSVLDTQAKQIEMNNLMGILWQYAMTTSTRNFLNTDSIQVRYDSITPLTLYAAICFLSNMVNGVIDYNKIHIEPRSLSSVIVLRNSDGLIKKSDKSYILTAEQLAKEKINPLRMMLKMDDPSEKEYKVNDEFVIDVDLYQKKLINILKDPFERYLKSELSSNQLDTNIFGDYLGKNGKKLTDISLRNVAFVTYIKKNFLVSFDIKPDTTIGELIKQYDSNQKEIGSYNNKDILKNIDKELTSASSLDEIMAWTYIKEQNIVSDIYQNMFEYYGTYTSYIEYKNSEFHDNLMNEVNSLLEKKDKEGIVLLLKEYMKSFYDYIRKITEGNVYLNIGQEGTSKESRYLDDLKVIFNQFLSIYSQIYKIDYIELVEDNLSNKINLFYLCLKDVTTEEGITEEEDPDDPYNPNNPGGGGHDPNNPGGGGGHNPGNPGGGSGNPNNPGGGNGGGGGNTPGGPGSGGGGSGGGSQKPKKPNLARSIYRLYLWLRYYEATSLVKDWYKDGMLLDYIGVVKDYHDGKININWQNNDIFKYFLKIEKFHELIIKLLMLKYKEKYTKHIDKFEDKIELEILRILGTDINLHIVTEDKLEFVYKLTKDVLELKDIMTILYFYRAISEEKYDKLVDDSIFFTEKENYTTYKDLSFDGLIIKFMKKFENFEDTFRNIVYFLYEFIGENVVEKGKLDDISLEMILMLVKEHPGYDMKLDLSYKVYKEYYKNEQESMYLLLKILNKLDTKKDSYNDFINTLTFKMVKEDYVP